jgi:hypothetical protein
MPVCSEARRIIPTSSLPEAHFDHQVTPLAGGPMTRHSPRLAPRSARPASAVAHVAHAVKHARSMNACIHVYPRRFARSVRRRRPNPGRCADDEMAEATLTSAPARRSSTHRRPLLVSRIHDCRQISGVHGKHTTYEKWCCKDLDLLRQEIQLPGRTPLMRCYCVS